MSELRRPGDRPEGHDRLKKDANGNPYPHLFNALILLEPLEAFFTYNELKRQTEFIAAPPWHHPETDGEGIPPYDDYQITSLQLWLQHRALPVNPDVAARAAEHTARRRSYHPVRNWLNSLSWDGNERLDTWLSTYLDAEDNDYTRAVGRKFLLGAVARAMEPGCKMDSLLVLEADQGDHKSTACQILGGEWYMDGLGSENKLDRDACMAMGMSWIVELAEIDEHIRGGANSRLKNFISRQVDTYKPPYGRALLRVPRSCVFIGTTNCDAYLRDPTGNRRYLPVRCWTKRGCRRDARPLARVRERLFAEAVLRYRAGDRWWFEDQAECAMAAEEQGYRLISHAADSAIEQYLRQGDAWASPVAVADIHHYISVNFDYLLKQGLHLNKHIPARLHALGYQPSPQRRDPALGRDTRGGATRVPRQWVKQ
jgi:predicted P-loop ATPase